LPGLTLATTSPTSYSRMSAASNLSHIVGVVVANKASHLRTSPGNTEIITQGLGNELRLPSSLLTLVLKDEIWPENLIISLIFERKQ